MKRRRHLRSLWSGDFKWYRLSCSVSVCPSIPPPFGWVTCRGYLLGLLYLQLNVQLQWHQTETEFEDECNHNMPSNKVPKHTYYASKYLESTGVNKPDYKTFSYTRFLGERFTKKTVLFKYSWLQSRCIKENRLWFFIAFVFRFFFLDGVKSWYLFDTFSYIYHFQPRLECWPQLWIFCICPSLKNL